ncbi:hypothetical protein [Streptomyces sp. YIM B13518]|uniref:hypothetical protein n=1 Tax=Streptomyces sp. YIM B13518 TaxID=3366316 RepID=UPI0036CD240F
MLIGRSVTTTALLALAPTACGTQQGVPSARSASPRPSFSPRPKRAQPAGAPTGLPSPSAPSASAAPSGSAAASGEGMDGRRERNGDGAPHYAENHAYRMRGR